MKNMFKSNKKGFTLVELLVVVVILTVLIVITGTTIFPMMGKTQKTAMVTYADRVLSNTVAAVQADELLNKQLPGFYKISALMDQDDYYGCVMVTKNESTGDYDYTIKMFSNSDKYYVYAATTDSANSIPGEIGDNGTITIDVDTSVEYTPDDSVDVSIGAVEALCDSEANFNDIFENPTYAS